MPKRKQTRAAAAAAAAEEANPQKKSRRISSSTSKSSTRDVKQSKKRNTNHDKSTSSISSNSISSSGSGSGSGNSSNSSRTFHFTKEVGQRLEICDKDNIWSAAKVIKIHPKQKKITINYTGWEKHWNEDISYVNNPRLANFETYTKRYKCLVDLFPKGRNTTSAINYTHTTSSSTTNTNSNTNVKTNKNTRNKNKNKNESSTKNTSSNKKTSTLWPCIVHIRTPNPLLTSLSQYKEAEEFLQTEPNVFIQPYGQSKNCLPKHIIAKSIDNGRWVKTKRIRKWRDDVGCIEGVVPLNFDLAHMMAKEDEDVEEYLTFHPFERGSLVHAEYRETPEGYEESMDESDKEDDDDEEESDEDDDDDKSDESSSRSSSKEKESKESMQSTISILKGNLPTTTNIDNELIYEPPPSLPQPTKVNTSIYPDYNIVKSTKTGKWIASFLRNGNDVYIGSFVTQTEARDAIMEAVNAESVNKEKKRNEASNSASASTTIVNVVNTEETTKPKTKIKSSSSSITTTTTPAATATTTKTVEANDITKHNKHTTQNDTQKTQSEENKQEQRQPHPHKVTMGSSLYKEQDMKALSFSTIISLESQQQSQQDTKQQQQQQQQQLQSRTDFSLHEWTMQNTKHKGYLKEKDERYRLKFEELKRKRLLKRKMKEARMISMMEKGKDSAQSIKK